WADGGEAGAAGVGRAGRAAPRVRGPQETRYHRGFDRGSAGTDFDGGGDVGEVDGNGVGAQHAAPLRLVGAPTTLLHSVSPAAASPLAPAAAAPDPHSSISPGIARNSPAPCRAARAPRTSRRAACRSAPG